MSVSHEEIYKVVCNIPEGRVATYGQIAKRLHQPHGARQVGYALAALNPDQDVPWHRVVNVRGEISNRVSDGGAEILQRILLEGEGIEFNSGGNIDLVRFLWDGE